MKEIKVGAIKTKVLPMHKEVFAREIWGPASKGKNVTVLHNYMLASGGAEMHIHEQNEHIFYVLKGELRVSNGNENLVISAGNSLVIEAGEPHEVRGTGNSDCEYICITSPPVIWNTD